METKTFVPFKSCLSCGENPQIFKNTSRITISKDVELPVFCLFCFVFYGLGIEAYFISYKSESNPKEPAVFLRWTSVSFLSPTQIIWGFITGCELFRDNAGAFLYRLLFVVCLMLLSTRPIKEILPFPCLNLPSLPPLFFRRNVSLLLWVNFFFEKKLISSHNTFFS